MMLRGRDDNGILKSGFLWKQTKGSIKKWKLYFFVLSRPCLLCFKSEDQMKEGREPKYKLELSDITLVEEVKKKKRKSKKFYVCYETLHDHGIIQFKGHDISDTNSWVSVITLASDFSKKRKDVHSELKTASFKMNVENNVRQRVIGSNPRILPKQVPEITFLRKVASCEFLSKSRDKKSKGDIESKRSLSLDGDLSRRSGSWKFSSPRPSAANKLSQGVTRSNTSVSTSSYSRQFLDSVNKRDYSRSNNNNFHHVKPGGNVKALINRHNSLLSVVPEERQASNPQRDWSNDYKRPSRSSSFDKARIDEARSSSAQNEYSRTAFSDSGREHNHYKGDLHKYSRLDYSYSGRVNQKSGFDRGLTKYQSFHGDTRRSTPGKFERNSTAYSSLQVPSTGGYTRDRHSFSSKTRDQEERKSYGTPLPRGSQPVDSNYTDRYSSPVTGGGFALDPGRSRRLGGYGIYHNPSRRVSPPGSVNMQSFGDPKFRIEEGRVWSERNSDTWSDIDSGFLEERL